MDIANRVRRAKCKDMILRGLAAQPQRHRACARTDRIMLLELFILAMVVGANNFATALALGSLGQAHKQWRILLVFAVFEFGVPFVGLWLGARVAGFLADGLGWLGPALIAALGVWTLLEARRKTDESERLARTLTSWRGIIGLSAVMSLDNLVVGFGLGLGGLPVLLTATMIMFCSVSFAWAGLRLGAQGRRAYQDWAKALSGLSLLAVAAADWLGWL